MSSLVADLSSKTRIETVYNFNESPPYSLVADLSSKTRIETNIGIRYICLCILQLQICLVKQGLKLSIIHIKSSHSPLLQICLVKQGLKLCSLSILLTFLLFVADLSSKTRIETRLKRSLKLLNVYKLQII